MSPNSQSRGQHHKRLAWVTAGGLGVALVVAIAGIAMPPGETLWHMVAAPEEDGSWNFVRIKGVDVSEAGYSAHLRWGEITGWDDGCNDCGFSDPDDPGRGVTHTHQACAELPTDRLFRL